MTFQPEPHLSKIAILDLRPTQITIGLREVERKRRDWAGQSSREEEEYLGRHLVPVVIGPAGRRYLIDHHHLALALDEEGVTHVLTNVIADLGHLPKRQFWTAMERFGWSHPFDAEGRRQPWQKMPKTVRELKDDPYRSLAGELRSIGGYAKTPMPFAEFMWADHFRKLVDKHLLRDNFEQAVVAATRQAREHAARYLPGWCGPEI